MRVGEVYSALALALAKSFEKILDVSDFMRIKRSKGWIIESKSKAGRAGLKSYSEFLKSESSAALCDDFVVLQARFQARFYFQNAQDDLSKFYEQLKFEPKMGEADSLSNQLLFIASLLKNELNENSQKLLTSFLISFFLPYVFELAKDVQNTAQSHFYKAMGYFLQDFYEGLMGIFSIKYHA